MLEAAGDDAYPVTVAGAALHELLARGIDEIPGAAVLVFDRALRYVLVRGRALADNGVAAGTYEGRPARACMSAERWAGLEPMYTAALAGRETVTELDGVANGRRYLVRTAPVRDDTGMIIGGASVASDVTELRRAERARAAGERRLQLTFASSPVGMALEDLDGRFLEVNPALCQMLDRPADWLLARRVSDVLDADDRGADLVARDQVASGLLESHSVERRLLRADGSRAWVLHALGLLTDERGAAERFVSHYVDVTEARGARERMAHLATHDGLTGLLNRDGFWSGVAPIVGHPGRAGTGLAVLFIDVDDFKAVNDSLGHAGGDEVLAEIGRRIGACLRSDDLVARFGGDEFVALLTSVREAADAVGVAEQLHRCVRRPIVVGQRSLAVTLSIGLAVVHPGDLSDAAVNRADLSMYRAKAAGGGRTELAS
jgi:diguanylate cyclase (GGDEF)-like protein/PAS domain S-box-containing protein